MNNAIKCDCCGKFRKSDDVVQHYQPDTEYCGEDLWFECKWCMTPADQERYRMSVEPTHE